MKLINTKINENANIVIECFHKCLCGNRNTNSFSSYNSLICKKNKRNFSLLCNKKHNQNKEQNENINKKLPAIYKDEIKSTIDNDHTSCCEQIKKGITRELSVNNPSELDKVKLFKENLRRYNLFNIYLEKIKAPLTKKEKERQRKIININSVKYFDDYISIFNIDSLLIYANHNFEELKKKGWKGNRKGKDAYQRVGVEYNEIKHTHISNENNIVIFFKIFIQFNKILKDFFYHKNEHSNKKNKKNKKNKNKKTNESDEDSKDPNETNIEEDNNQNSNDSDEIINNYFCKNITDYIKNCDKIETLA
ncbi:conserved Plasmodium protein, unknown function, partial [Plasmodium ovale curtisi]